MNRSELERLDRDTLIARAESIGVVRARVLTRPELIDELLVRAEGGREDVQRVRGFFGRARDLLVRVVERGLHLPDAAERLRGRVSSPASQRSAAAPLPTVTLAEIYAAQGHRERAVDTLRDLLAREPDHAVARALVGRLQDEAYEGPTPPTLAPEEDTVVNRPVPPEVLGAEAVEGASGEDAPVHELEPGDECVALPVDGQTLFVYWSLRARTRAHLAATLPEGGLAVRVLVVSPTWDGPRSSVRDVEVRAHAGDTVIGGLPPGAVVRAAVGWRVGERFVSAAHSPALEPTPVGEGEALVRWTLRGAQALQASDGDAAAIERALEAARARAQIVEGRT